SQALGDVAPYLRPRDRKHALLASLALLTVLIEKLVAVLPPLAIRHAVDAISAFDPGLDGVDDGGADPTYEEVQRRTARAVAASIATYFLLRTLDASLSSLQSVCQRAVSLDAERRFAAGLFAHLQVLGPAYHLERHAGELLRILSRGGDATSTIIDALWFTLFPTLFEAAVVGAVFWKLLGMPSIAATTVGAVALFVAYTVVVTGTRLEQRRRVLDRSEAVGRIETEALVNYETVVMFGREGKEVDAYDRVRKEYADERLRMLGLFAGLQLGQQAIRLAGTCVGLWLAGRATVYGIEGEGGREYMSPGSFVVVQLYIQQLFQPLSVLGFTYRKLSEALTDLEKAIAMLRSEPLVVDSEDALEWEAALERRNEGEGTGGDPTATASGDIKFENVSFRYKIKSNRKRLGGPDLDDTGAQNGGGRHGRGGGRRSGGRGAFGRRGMWGGHGKAVWTGTGGVNFWIRDAKNRGGGEESEDGKAKEKVEVGGIQGVSFHIPAGKTAALVGPSESYVSFDASRVFPPFVCISG
ncbi:hypothetical protein ACHAWF_003215, partial [Thalassiosira exigua]